MPKVIITLRNINQLPHRPFALTGQSGKVYGHANYSPKYAGHTISMDFEEFRKAGIDIVRGFDLPLSKWSLCDVDVQSDEDGESKLAAALDEAQAQVATLQGELEQTKQERDAAIRALQGRQAEERETLDAIRDIPAAQIEAANVDMEEMTAAMDSATPPEEAPTVNDPDGNPPSEAPIETVSRREELEALSTNFRVIRKLALDAGVEGAKSATTKAGVIDAWLAHEEAAPTTNG